MIMRSPNNQHCTAIEPTSVHVCPTVHLQRAATCRVKDISTICQVGYYHITHNVKLLTSSVA